MPDFLLALHFIRPWWLALLPLLLLSYAVLRRAERAREARAPEFLPSHLAAVLMRPAAAQRRLWPLNLIHSLLLLALLALAGPSWERADNPLRGDESALVIALDVSTSMARDDVQPSRLQRAKQKITDLLAQRGGSYTGLIVYAGTAHRVIPLSDDAAIVANFIEAIDHYIVPEEGKNPAAVLALAEQMLAENVGGSAPINAQENASGTLPGSGSLLLFADAVPQTFLQQAQDWIARHGSTQMLVWGVGNDADEQQSLKRLAAGVDSYYQALSADKSDVAALQWRIQNALYISDSSNSDWREKAAVLLWPLAILLLLGFRSGTRLLGPLAVLLVLPLLQAAPALAADNDLPPRASWLWLDMLLTRDQQGMVYLRLQQPAQAAARFDDPMWRGLAYYRAENFAAAAASFAQVDSLTARYNRANALAQGQHYVRALRAYDAVLRQAPAHQQARKNRALVQALVDEIDAMSEHQAAEAGEAAFELGDEPQRGNGAERDDTAVVEEQFSAEQLLADKQIREQWMQQVQPDPARFLAAKFAMQAALEELDDEARGASDAQ